MELVPAVEFEDRFKSHPLVMFLKANLFQPSFPPLPPAPFCIVSLRVCVWCLCVAGVVTNLNLNLNLNLNHLTTPTAVGCWCWSLPLLGLSCLSVFCRPGAAGGFCPLLFLLFALRKLNCKRIKDEGERREKTCRFIF